MRLGSLHRRLLTLAGMVGIAALVLASSAHYTVRRGDTLWGIGTRHCASVKALAAANGIRNPDRIYPGQRLVLPGSAGRGPTQGAVHRVCPGENLTLIAARHRVGIAELAAANHLSDRDYIQVGQRLAIPGTARSAPAPVRKKTAERLITSTARRYGWNPAFVKAVAWQESGWKQHVVSRTGAVGIMQVQPGTGEFVSRRLVGRPLDLTDPADNVLAGVAFLDYLWDLTGGDTRRTLGGYYQGLASIRAHGWYPDTVRYVDNVLTLEQRFD